MTDAIGWLATAVMAVASIDIAHKNVRGLWLMVVANCFWGYVGCCQGLSSLIGVSIMMGMLDCYGITQWRKDHARLVSDTV